MSILLIFWRILKSKSSTFLNFGLFSIINNLEQYLIDSHWYLRFDFNSKFQDVFFYIFKFSWQNEFSVVFWRVYFGLSSFTVWYECRFLSSACPLVSSEAAGPVMCFPAVFSTRALSSINSVSIKWWVQNKTFATLLAFVRLLLGMNSLMCSYKGMLIKGFGTCSTFERRLSSLNSLIMCNSWM